MEATGTNIAPEHQGAMAPERLPWLVVLLGFEIPILI